ncbi:hypothetical protein RRF57_000636 [Xylaria bambusicola]|uniref:UDP-N-acetylglucosamine--dolichyl-phosphate N-acetylglucosaminephosphotransferase n=1 Tax=Xylaria bambusicola TaxID=326684 RepID=A0AAN7YUC1_9PEZI
MATQVTSTALSRTETINLSALSLVCVAVLVRTLEGEGEPLIASLALSGLAFAATYATIKWLGPTFIKAGLKGRDLSKVNNSNYLPECMGAICAIVYLLIIIVFIPFPFYKDIVVATSGGGNRDVVMNVEFVEKGRLLHKFPHSKVRIWRPVTYVFFFYPRSQLTRYVVQLASFLSAIISLQSITLLGIGDDLFDIRWRHKFFIPAFASIPLLIIYFVDFGVTSIVLPTFLQPYVGRELIDLAYSTMCTWPPSAYSVQIASIY